MNFLQPEIEKFVTEQKLTHVHCKINYIDLVLNDVPTVNNKYDLSIKTRLNILIMIFSLKINWFIWGKTNDPLYSDQWSRQNKSKWTRHIIVVNSLLTPSLQSITRPPVWKFTLKGVVNFSFWKTSHNSNVKKKSLIFVLVFYLIIQSKTCLNGHLNLAVTCCKRPP